MSIDWNNSLSEVSRWFSVKECLWLHTWQRMATVDDGLDDRIKANLFELCSKLDQIRDFLKHPLIVTSMYRPQDYSPLVGGTSTDVHTRGLACDFVCQDLDCETVKELILPSLEAMNMRMEKGTNSWVHLDIAPVGPSGRYFTP